MKVTLVLEINLFEKRNLWEIWPLGKRSYCTVWSIVGGYDDDIECESDSFDDYPNALKIIGPIDGAIAHDALEKMNEMLTQLGHDVDILTTADD